MSRYLEALLKAGLVNSSVYKEALDNSLPLKSVLQRVELEQKSNLLPIAKLLAHLARLPFSAEVDIELSSLKAIARRFEISSETLIATRFDELKLHLVTYDPNAIEASQELGFLYRLQPKLTLIPYSEFCTLQERLSVSEDDLLEHMLLYARRNLASDVHIQPNEDCIHIKMRIDGLLQEWRKASREQGGKLTCRIKVLANLDITEQRHPQDGRINWQGDNFRVSSMPTICGEKLVIRIQNKLGAPSLDQLGLSQNQLMYLKNKLTSPHGLILVTGPTGSGKSLTLYACLKELYTPSLSICTVEDPVEMQDAHYNQVQIDSNIGYSFANALRALLRQDPDIIMLGEIRDSESARIAVHAAQTGHLVLSTLHTNNALESIPRLLSLGISQLDIDTTLKLVIAQRLVRRRCTQCHQGCSHCHMGYKGRIGLFEFLQVEHSSTCLFDDMSLKVSADLCVNQGITDRVEIERVLGKDA